MQPRPSSSSKLSDAEVATKLHQAVNEGSIETLKLLLNLRPHLILYPISGLSFLDKAIERQDVMMVKAILECLKNSKLSIDQKKRVLNYQHHVTKNTPLHIAVRNKNEEIVSALLDAGANPCLKNSANFVPIALALQKKDETDWNLVKVFARELPSEAYDSVVLDAINAKQMALAKQFLNFGASPAYFFNQKNDKRLTSLHLAIQQGDDEITALLLEKGALGTRKNNEEMTPAVYAAHLISSEKNVETRSKYLNCLIAFRIRKDERQLGEYSTALFLIIEANNLSEDEKCQVFMSLLQAGADVNFVRSQDKSKLTYLHIAVKKDYPKLVKLLLAFGANPNLKNKYDKTPVALSTTISCLLPFVYLKNNALDSLQLGAGLLLAAEENNVPLMRTLLANHAAHHWHKKGTLTTSAHFAVQHDNPEMIRILRAVNADISKRDASKKSPLDIAQGKISLACMAALVDDNQDCKVLSHSDLKMVIFTLLMDREYRLQDPVARMEGNKIKEFNFNINSNNLNFLPAELFLKIMNFAFGEHVDVDHWTKVRHLMSAQAFIRHKLNKTKNTSSVENKKVTSEEGKSKYLRSKMFSSKTCRTLAVKLQDEHFRKNPGLDVDAKIETMNHLITPYQSHKSISRFHLLNSISPRDSSSRCEWLAVATSDEFIAKSLQSEELGDDPDLKEFGEDFYLIPKNSGV